MSTPRTGAPVFPGDPRYIPAGDPRYIPAGDPRYIPPCRFLCLGAPLCGCGRECVPTCGCGAKFDALVELSGHVAEYNEAQRAWRHAS
jgi:hypothetical protein